eukprot:TRINITY_DN28103_c0_g1_i1.p1 TRINITY_DN28103_c0_g1~~TRINITY_DN28103_c0_g1_i1.p1  ORF type:complete len:333 (+),score=75.38 TRINITY_DN28103_c0_g1_i1:82-1080(+)
MTSDDAAVSPSDLGHPDQDVNGPLKPDPAASGLTEDEIEEYSRIKCCVCGMRVKAEEVAEHSRICVLEPAPNLQLQLDKWCIASANMTPAEQRTFLHMRRTEELAKVEEIETEIKGHMPKLWWMSGRFGYIISSKWLRTWRSFVGVGRPTAETNSRPPAPIINSDLFEIDGNLRKGLQEGLQHDYQILEQPMWDFFVQIYGGGPAILRYNTSGVLPALSDQQVSFEGKWLDFRPDTGHGRVFDPYSGRGFDGEIQDGILWNCTGKGLLQNGSHYEGQVVQGLPEGAGREVKPDGSVLEGNFRKGKLHGFGRILDAQGAVEEGEWEDGELQGI